LSAAPEAQPALKEIFNRRRLRHIAEEARAVYPAFDSARFLAASCEKLDELSIMQRSLQSAISCNATWIGPWGSWQVGRSMRTADDHSRVGVDRRL
jgi:3-methyladenine DNA glycosylase AlkC